MTSSEVTSMKWFKGAADCTTVTVGIAASRYAIYRLSKETHRASVKEFTVKNVKSR